MRGTNSEREAAPLFEIDCFGRGEIRVEGVTIIEKAFKTQKVKWLLVLLALAPSSGLREDDLIEALWPETDLAGRRSLNTALCILRKAVGSEGGRAIERSNGFIRIRPGAGVETDVQRFETSVRASAQRCEEGDQTEALRLLSEAATSYHGRFLDGCYLEWALRRREDLEIMATTAFTELSVHALEMGNAERALECASRAVEIDPYCENAHQVVMRAHTRLGRPDRAIRHFERCQRKLRDDLDVEPSIALVEESLRARFGTDTGSALRFSSRFGNARLTRIA